MSIYVNYTSTDLRDFLRQFFSYQADDYLLKSVTTFRDIECTQVQCRENKFRSFDDLLRIAQTYYPDLTRQELMKTLLTLDIKDEHGNSYELHMGNCSGIDRIRVCYVVGYEPDWMGLMRMEKYDSLWSWEELLGEIGISSRSEYNQFIKDKS